MDFFFSRFSLFTIFLICSILHLFSQFLSHFFFLTYSPSPSPSPTLSFAQSVSTKMSTVCKHVMYPVVKCDNCVSVLIFFYISRKCFGNIPRLTIGVFDKPNVIGLCYFSERSVVPLHLCVEQVVDPFLQHRLHSVMLSNNLFPHIKSFKMDFVHIR